MNRGATLLRDYGMSLGLVAASVLLFVTTMLPQMKRNRALDEAFVKQLQERRRVERNLERLQILQNADCDPLIVERMAREIFHDLGLPPGESYVPNEPFEES